MSAVNFSMDMNRRRLATLTDAMTFYNIQKEKRPKFDESTSFDSFDLTGELFKTDPQSTEIIRTYADDLRKNSVFLGV